MLEVKRMFIGIQPVCLSPLTSGSPQGMLIVCAVPPLTVNMMFAVAVLMKLQDTPLTFPETDDWLMMSAVPVFTAPLLSRGLVFPSSAAKADEAIKKGKRMDRIASLLVVFMRSSLKERLSRLLTGAVLEVSARD